MDSRICGYCGDEFNPSKPWQRFCSKKCRKSLYSSKKKSTDGRDWWTPVDGASPKKCPVCSRIFYHNKRKYCSDSCSYTSMLRRSMKFERRKTGVQGYIARRCPECRLLFVTNNFRKKFCGGKCSRRFHNKKQLQGYHRPPQIMKKTEVCRYIYDSKDDPDSISDLIEDWTGVHCPVKDKEESDGLSRE